MLPVQLPLASSDPFLPHGAEAAPPGPRQASQGGQPAPSWATGPCRVGKVGLRPRSDVGEGEAGSCLRHPRPRVGLGTLALSQPRKEASLGKATLEALPGKLRGTARQLPGFELPLGWGRGDRPRLAAVRSGMAFSPLPPGKEPTWQVLQGVPYSWPQRSRDGTRPSPPQVPWGGHSLVVDAQRVHQRPCEGQGEGSH